MAQTSEPSSVSSSSLLSQFPLVFLLFLAAVIVYFRFSEHIIPSRVRKVTDSPTHNAHVAASEAALDTLTDAAQDHPKAPVEHIHAGAAEQTSHSWVKKCIPDAVLNDYENRYHLGNYVIDRETGEKTFEQMR